MTTLTNVSRQLVTVADAGVMKDIAPGASVDVDGRQNWKDDLFVKAGWLKLSEPEQAEATPPTRRKR